MEQPLFYQTDIETVEKYLQTSVEKGLNESEIAERRLKYGYNEFEKQKKKSLIIRFLEQFKSFMIIVLIIAAIISGIIGVMHHEGIMDSIVILCVVILNAIIGVAQETKAEASLEALEKMSAPQCKVIRNGIQEIIPSRELVPGDVVVLDTGDAVPADLRLVEAINLKIQESALTGESLPIEKNTAPISEANVPLGDRENMAFASCIVTYGRGKGIVTEIGMKTEIGKIAALIQSVPDVVTPLQRKLNELGKVLGLAALGICALIFVVGILYGREWFEMFMIAVSLAVAAIPESLPAIATIVLAVGVQRLAKKHAIVRTLPAVEVLGCTTVICSDKTGTLTQNKMTVVKIFADNALIDFNTASELNEDHREILKIAVLCNDTKLSENNHTSTTIGDPTETALVDAGLHFSINKNGLEQTFPRVEEIPFDSERKLMTTVHQSENQYFVATKGALDELLSCCTHVLMQGKTVALTEEEIQKIKTANRNMAENALRVLGMAYKKIDAIPQEKDIAGLESGLIFAGMVGMIDPPRSEVRDAVLTCREAGIKPVMITGDHKITAVAIARSLDILEPENEAITGAELQQMNDEELSRHIENISVYARVSPENKVRIVQQFQKKGDVVAMTGDGVNDAPALKLADIGVAMGITGTDVSKQASDIILTDDNFATIVTSVREGRRIYDNILKAIHFLLATNIGELTVLFIAIMANWAPPLLAIHILMVNMVTDSFPALALSFDPPDSDIMQRKPNDAHQTILNKPFVVRVISQGMMIGLLSLTAFAAGMYLDNNVASEMSFFEFMRSLPAFSNAAVAQTMAFAVLGLSQMVHIFNVRSGKSSAFKGMFSNRYLWGAVVISTAIIFGILEIPALHSIFQITTLSMTQWFIVIGCSLMPLPIMEIAKLIRKTISRGEQR